MLDASAIANTFCETKSSGYGSTGSNISGQFNSKLCLFDSFTVA